MAKVLTVNLAHPRTNPDSRGTSPTGIDKRPADGPVEVRAPGPMHGGLGSGLVGDLIGNQRVHGGDDQAVYAYAREDLDDWQKSLDRELPNGCFGENVTTSGIDVTNARIGEHWLVGSGGLRLQVCAPRIPCRTFQEWLSLAGWVKKFTATAIPGAYLRVIEPGRVSAGDAVEIIDRPDHQVTVGLVFRALTLEPELLPELVTIDALPEEIKDHARRRTG